MTFMIEIGASLLRLTLWSGVFHHERPQRHAPADIVESLPLRHSIEVDKLRLTLWSELSTMCIPRLFVREVCAWVLRLCCMLYEIVFRVALCRMFNVQL